MENTFPLVSIVICTRNRAKTLPGTLHSLTMLQSRHNWEALVVDNASVDETAQVIRSADDCGGRLRCLRVDQIGLGAARDAGWRAARGAIVAFTDDDCYMQADYLDAVIAAFGSHPEVGCTGGRIMLFDPLDAPVTIDERREPHCIEPYRFINAGEVQGANFAFRRAALDVAGGFDPGLGAGTPFPCEDIDAVAAVAWRGYAIRFDPNMVVFHHHRRRSGEAVRQLERSYDRGRGAYYAKYILRTDTRSHYVANWWSLANSAHSVFSYTRTTRELSAAITFMLRRRHYAFLIVALPIAIAAGIVIGLRTAFRVASRRVYRLVARRQGEPGN